LRNESKKKMSHKWVTSILLPLAGLVIILAFAYGCDQLSDALITYNSLVFDITVIKVILPITKLLSNLISMGGVLILFWMLMTRTPRLRLTGAIFFLVGFSLIAYNLLLVNLGGIIPFGLYMASALNPDSLFVHTAGGMAVIGLFILFFKKMPKNYQG
jgi:hypothetical protein